MKTNIAVVELGSGKKIWTVLVGYGPGVCEWKIAKEKFNLSKGKLQIE